MRTLLRFFLAVLVAAAVLGTLESCGKSDTEGGHEGGQGSRRGRGAGGPPGAGFGGGSGGSTAVPVEVASVERRSISQYIQANGTLEAENEVDLVARINGPIEELRTEEGKEVAKGQLLARIDDDDVRAQAEISRVGLEEARLNFERAEQLYTDRLLSPEAYEQAKSQFETARAQYDGNQLLLGYTEIRAPFSGRIVRRYVDLAQHVSPGAPVFRLSDFDPLLCPVQVPERDLPKLAIGQNAYITVEAWPGERFDARVLRISPVIDAATGTVKVTLDIDAREQLRPGMFARVFLEIDTHDHAIVIPKTALSLESLGDTVFVHRDGVAEQRDVEVGFEEGDVVEILSGVSPGEQIVVVGQDGLSAGTPIEVLGGAGEPRARAAAGREGAASPGEAVRDGAGGPDGRRTGGGGFRARGMPDPSQMTPEQLERIKERMRDRGLSEAEIEQRLERMRERGTTDPASPPGQ